MRRILGIGVMIGALMLAGCQGGGTDEEAPTPAPVVTLVAGEDGRTIEDLIEDATRPLGGEPELLIEEEVPVPAVHPTEEPVHGQLFDSVRVGRSGGRGQPEYAIEIYPDGRLIVNGQEGRLPAHEIGALQALFDEIDVYAIPNNVQTWASRPDAFRYQFEVSMGQYNTLLEGENAYIPQAIKGIIAQVIGYSGYVP